MRRRLLPGLALALLATSCTRQVQTAAGLRGMKTTPVATVMRRQAANALDAGEGDAAGRALRQKMAAEPDNIQARLELARHYEKAGFPDLALEHYRLAAARFPDSGEVHLGMARSLRAMDMEKEAAAGLKKFLAAHPRGKATAHAWLGILLDELGEYQDAEKTFRAALALSPRDDSLHNNLGYNLLLQGKRREAAEEFRRALALNPGSVVARNNLGVALAHEPKEAVLHWQSVSDPATAHSNLAALLIEEGRYAEARKELDTALGYQRDHPAALANLGLISELDGKPAAMPSKAAATPTWKRMARGLWKFVAGIEEPKARDEAKTASR